MNDSTLQAAHGYARRGWSVLVLHSVDPTGRCWRKPGQECATYFARSPDGRVDRSRRVKDVADHRSQAGKHPVDARWQSQATLSGPDIQASFEEYPGANVGLRTGSGSGFFVLDVDPDNGGFESLDALVADHGGLPATYTVRTGSGGLHYYFAQPDFEVTNARGTLPAGIDIRGTGGQVVAAPSVTAKGAYSVLDDRDPAPAPGWLLEALRPRPVAILGASEPVPLTDLTPGEAARLAAYTEAAVQRILDELSAAQIGTRDDTTYRSACSLIELANAGWNTLTLEQAYTLLGEHAPVGGDFTADDVNAKWLSAVGKIGDKARGVPPHLQGDAVLPVTASQPEAPPASQPDSGQAPEAPLVDPASFFDGGAGLKAENLAQHIMAAGPLAWGRDEQFWAYNGGVWRPARRVIIERATRALRNRYRMAHAAAANDITRAQISRLDFDPVKDVINFRNGLLDWRTGELGPHSPDVPTTIQLPVHWDDSARCPRFDAFLGSILAPETVQVVWEMIGYLMYSGNPLQCAFLLYGSGQNGKGTLLRVVEALLGRENIASQTLDSLNNNRFAPANLFGKIANIAGDIDATFQESTAAFKKLTGEDSFDGERKHQDAFTFTSWAVPVFSANKIPGSADVTEGYTRRWVVVPFNTHIDDADKVIGLSDQLVAELPGIAAKAIPALRAVLARRRFEQAGEVAEAREVFVLSIDQVRQWLGEETEPEEGARIKRADVYTAYRSWCDRNGVGKLKASEFYARLEALGCHRKIKGERLVVGLRPKLRLVTPEDYAMRAIDDGT